jgi:hypothetical protein
MTKLLAKSAFLLGALANLLPCCAQVSPPVFSPPGGTYSRPFTLAMTADSGAIIYYTTDGTAPSVDSNVYSGPITIKAGTTTVQAFAATYYFGDSTTTSAIYTVAPPASTTQLKSSASTLVLPGSLTLTATANPTASGGAVPSGNVNFYSNTSKLLGTAPLQMIPSSQAWTGEAVLATPISYPAGLASVVLAKGAQPVLVSAQTSAPNVALYKLSPGGNTLNAYTYTNSNMTTTDAVVAGYFLQPASSSVQSFLVHRYGEYDVFDGSTAASDTGLSLNAPKNTSPSGFNSQHDNEALSVADFNNDGYDDLGVLVKPYSSHDGTYYVYYGGVAGVAINAINLRSPGVAPGFNQLLKATPTGLSSSTKFCPIAITTGHFMSPAGTQLAVLAYTPQDTCSNLSSGQFSVYLFAYENGALNEIGKLPLPNMIAFTLAAADLNNDGISDLIIGEYKPSIGILTALGAGKGTFKGLSALYSGFPYPLAFTVNDFNADGKIDVAYTSPNGYSVLTGDGAGGFSGHIDTALSSTPGGIASGDFNGDTLPDLAIVPGSAGTNNSNIDIELNSASAQAVLPLGNLALAAGSYSLTAVFPGNSNFATSTSPAVSVTVSQTVPVITWPGGSLEYGTPLSAAQLNATANVPGTFTYTPGLGAILSPGNDVISVTFAPTDSFDYAPASGSATFSVLAPSAAVTASATTVTAGQQPTITVTVDPYPVSLTATATLTFTPAQPITVQDPDVKFKNDGTTETVTISAGTTTSSNQFQFQAGSTAGTITVTTHLALDNKQDVTPSNLQPLTVTVLASPPNIESATLTRPDKTLLQISVIALSSTRDMNEAHFHFTPASGKSLATSDLTVPLTSAFKDWYGDSSHNQYGTNFTYTQPFTLDDATDVQSVSITLTNSAGTSEAATAQ